MRSRSEFEIVRSNANIIKEIDFLIGQILLSSNPIRESASFESGKLFGVQE